MHAPLRPLARLLGTALLGLGILHGTAPAGGTQDDYTSHPRLPDATADPTVSDIDQSGDTIVLGGSSGVSFTVFPVGGSPDLRGHVALDATAIAVAGDDCVWVATTDEKLHRIDFSDVDNPVIDTTIDMNLGLVTNMTYHPASGKILASSSMGFIEITVPLDCGPGVPVANLFAPSSNARGVAGDGSHIVGAIGSILLTFDPTMTPTSTTGTALADGTVNSLSVQDDVIAAVTSSGSLSLVDRVALNIVYSTPAPADGMVRQSPDLAVLLDPAKRMAHQFVTTLPPGTMRNSSLATAGTPRGVRVDDSRIVVATDEKVMYGTLGDRQSPAVLDQENPFIPTAAWRSAALQLLAIAGQNTVDLYDTSNPADLDSVGSYNPGTSLAGQDVEGYEHFDRLRSSARYLLVGSLVDFLVLDITDPANPTLAGSIPGASSCVAVAPDGSRAARSDIQRNVHLVDLTDPATPTDRGSFQLPNGVEDLVLDGNWLVAASIGQTGRWDVSDPDAPVLDHTVPVSGIRGLAKSATTDHFYLGIDGTQGRVVRYDFGTQMELASVSVPAAHLAVHTTAAAALGGGTELVYASSPGGSVFVIDWTDPAQPAYVGEYTDPAFQPQGLVASGETVVVTDSRFPGRVVVLPAHGVDGGPTGAPGIARPAPGLAPWPNPFTSSTTVGFSLPHAGDVRVDVFDAAGRRVRTLADGPRSAGRQRIVWDGRTTGGTAAGTGVYFVRVTAAGRSEHAKVLRVR